MRKLAWAAVLIVPFLQTTGEAQDRDDKLKLEYLEGVNLHEITIFVQKKTGYKFLWGEDVQLKNKKVYFRSKEPITDAQVIFRIYQSFLQVNDLLLVQVHGKDAKDPVFKIQLGTTLSKRATRFEEGKVSPEDRVVTRVFSLRYVSPRDVHTALINMTTFPNAILPIESASVLLITDYDYNIQRFERIIEQMDRPRPGVELRRVELKYALASDVAEMWTKLQTGFSSRTTTTGGRPVVQPTDSRGVPTGGEQVQVVPDKRTNSVLIVADVNIIDQVEKMIRELDSETGFETSGVYIVHLKHSNAADISKTLNAIYGVSVDQSGMPSGGGGSRPGQPTGPATTPTTPTTSSTGSAPTGNEPKIVADTRTNSIMIITDRNTFKTLEELIRRLDSRRPQVLIKATVVEVRSKDNFDFGVELARVADPTGSLELIGRTKLLGTTLTADTSTNTFSLTPVDTTGLTLALIKDKIGNIAALIKASQLKEKVSVLDEPEVTTADNGTAEMKVTNEVPVLQTTFQGTSGTPVTTFNKMEKAETTLSISPHISEGGYLRLETTIKIEKFTGESTDKTIPPPKTTREIKTNSIMVPNGRTIVIGGIVSQDDTDSVLGIPILSDIPIIGLLFRSNTKTQQYRTLYIFITPYILYDDNFGDIASLSGERKDEIERMRGETMRRLQLDGPPRLAPRSTYRFSRRGE
ncbi:MAG: hypothetical protein HYY17_12390 [Planctomycetes bacterium]|nr:hypothetical protein [Planctomycetota bacterium]